MRAIVHRRYGSPDVLRCEEIAAPTPGAGEVLLRVRAAAVNPIDRSFSGRPYLLRLLTGLRRPRDGRVGRDVAGEVEAVGAGVSAFTPGDAVFGCCKGAFAEQACGTASALAAKPDGITFEQAAAAPVAALTALQGLRDHGRLRAGQTVLVNGASGGVGTFAVQIAKSLGAEVTGVCSGRNVALVRSIGADHVVDYERDDFTRGPRRYDLILDCVGNRPLVALRRVLAPGGTCVLAGAPPRLGGILARGLGALLRTRLGRERFVLFIARLRREDLQAVGDLLASGAVVPVVERHYGLDEVPAALRHLATGRARGKLIVVP